MINLCDYCGYELESWEDVARVGGRFCHVCVTRLGAHLTLGIDDITTIMRVS